MKHKIVNSGMFSLFITIIFIFMVVVDILLLIKVCSENSEYPYATFIKKQLCVSCIPIMALCVFFYLFGWIFFKKIDSAVVDNWMIIVWLSFCLAFAVYISITISYHYNDIKNEEYIVYTGEFKKDHTRDFVFLNDENSTRLKNRNETFLETGHYSGTIVYSLKTKYVLSYLLNNGENASVVNKN